MAGYKAPDFKQRAALASEAKQKAIDRLKAKPPVDEQAAAARAAAREEKEAAAAEKAAAAQQAAIAAAPKVLTEAERKAARDARYAARKARK